MGKREERVMHQSKGGFSVPPKVERTRYQKKKCSHKGGGKESMVVSSQRKNFLIMIPSKGSNFKKGGSENLTRPRRERDRGGGTRFGVFGPKMKKKTTRGEGNREKEKSGGKRKSGEIKGKGKNQGGRLEALA